MTRTYFLCSMGCVLSIQAGAGGADAMDSAQMLLQMYARWAERKAYACSIVDVMPVCIYMCMYVYRYMCMHGYVAQCRAKHECMQDGRK